MLKFKMKFLKPHYIIALMFFASEGAFAQNVEQIYMKSGSVVEGYIAEQNPGTSITIQSTKATIVVNSDSLRAKIIERMPVDSLSNEWKEWASDNNKFIDREGGKYLELCTLEFNHSVYRRVFLLEKGSLLKFIDPTSNKYHFRWGDMYRTVKNKRPANLFSGLKEVLVLNDDTHVEGQIREQFPGKDLKIETDNGEVLSYKFSQIKKIKTERLNDRLDLWSQIQLLDIIRLRNEPNEFVGFILSRTLGKDLEFVFEDGQKRIIQQSQVLSYAKIPNDKYVAVYDRILKEGEILLNGEPAYFTPLQSQGEYLLLGEVVSAQLVVGDIVSIEANLDEPNIPITLVKAHIESIPKKDGRKGESIFWPVITYQDLVQSYVGVNREITPLGNVKVSFPVTELGDYVLYVQGRNEYIVINVIENNK